MCSGGAFHWTRNFPLVELTDVGTHLVPSKRGFHPMKLHRCAIACALAFASGNALSQTSSATTAVVADTLIQLYGHLDLSLDSATKGIKPGQTNAPFGTATPTGHLSWQPDISSNLSYVGIRGGRDISSGLRAAFQFGTPIHLSATPRGSVSSPSPDHSVKGALASPHNYRGNAPALGPAPTVSCTDGSFGSAYSIAAAYEAGPAYLIAAYEKHKGVNRTGDELPPFPAAGAVGVVDEQAMKAGVQYKLPTGTTLNAIYERMTRHAPDPTANERQRNGFWLAATQALTPQDDVNLGWAHAGQTPGDPGAGPVDNKANMYTAGYKHHFDRRTNWYAVYARQQNHTGAHYDLGASGHGITTDCHDADGHCFPGTTLQALSVGMQYNF